MTGLEELGLTPAADEALASYLGGDAPNGKRSTRTVVPGLAEAVEREIRAEAALVLPPLLPTLLGAALSGKPPQDPRALAIEAAAARDHLNEAARRATAAYLRGALRPALLDLASYLGGYDKTADQGRLPGRPKDWRHVESTIRRRLRRAATAYGEMGTEVPEPNPRPTRGPLEKLLGRLKETLDRASEEVRALAVAPLPSTPEEAEESWRRLAEACVPPLALAGAIRKGLEKREAAASSLQAA